MISTEKRLDLLNTLGKYLVSNDEQWQDIKQRAVNANAWFNIQNIELAVRNIAEHFLNRELLSEWMVKYKVTTNCKKIGIVTAGNIPLVGFHDLLCGFMSGHQVVLKLSSKDEVMMKHIIAKLIEWEPEVAEQLQVADNLKGCDAYIATGSNNTARYFEQYFAKYPHIIRKNRTSVAIIEGNETKEELEDLAKDVFTYYGLGCRNVTQVCIPETYDLASMLEVFSAWDELILHHKYKNNYDYHLAIYLLNKVPYLTNGSLLMVENALPFSAVSVLHYRYYNDAVALAGELQHSGEIQTIVGRNFTPFGTSQQPSLGDYADGVDTMKFLCDL